MTKINKDDIVFTTQDGLARVYLVKDDVIHCICLEKERDVVVSRNEPSLKLLKEYDPILAQEVQYLSSPELVARLEKLSGLKKVKSTTSVAKKKATAVQEAFWEAIEKVARDFTSGEGGEE